ncbi:MAG: MFS transporter [Proteobacteria bacterium]|nr:MFS transporter [Pseudomonadota bacterium]MDA0994706.1 MFS transporter [Pseudomonadota bacterium]
MKSILKFFAAGKDQPRLTDTALIDEQFRYYRRNVITVAILCYGLGYVCRLALNVVKKPLMDAGIFTPEEVGLIGSMLLYGYALGKFSNGLLSDYANVKRFFAAGLFLSAMMNFGMSFSSVVWISALLWVLNGWFQGFGAPSCAVALTSWFSNNERGRYYGLWSTAHAIGEGLTYLGIALLIALPPKGLGLHWQYGFWIPATICVLAAVIVYIYLPDRPGTLGLPSVAEWRNDGGAKAKAAVHDAASILKDQLRVVSIPAIWIIALASSSMYITRYAVNSWGNVYLQEIRGFDLFDANFFIFLNTAAGILGCVAYGYLSDKLFDARRPPANLLFGLMELLPLFIIFYGPANSTVLAIALVVYGFGLSGILASLGGLFALDIAPKKVAGAAMGFIGIFSYFGAGLQDYISGKLIYDSEIRVVFDLGATSQTVFFYDYSVPIVFWIGASVVSMILAGSLWRVRASV